jgi:hypothetical protein
MPQKSLFNSEEELETYKANSTLYYGCDFSRADIYKRSEKTELQSAYGVSAAAVATVVLGSVLYKYHTVIRDKAQKLYKKQKPCFKGKIAQVKEKSFKCLSRIYGYIVK